MTLGVAGRRGHNVVLPAPASSPIELSRVSSYYDAFAEVAEERYAANQILVRVRAAFRRAVERYPASAMLDLGCGPGTDLAYFARLYPGRRYLGIDVSPRMVEVARANAHLAAVPALRVERGTAAELPGIVGAARFDLCYSFFGPLNTDPDLGAAARALRQVIAPGGALVLSFVNRLYLLDSVLHLLRGRLGRASARLSDRWRGYSEATPLDARLYFPGQIRAAFAAAGFDVERREGLSIVYPAWYRAHRIRADGSLARALWLGDRLLNRTPLWCTGEHLLYVLRPR
jgi:SAM-dependent methyltransferase